MNKKYSDELVSNILEKSKSLSNPELAEMFKLGVPVIEKILYQRLKVGTTVQKSRCLRCNKIYNKKRIKNANFCSVLCWRKDYGQKNKTRISLNAKLRGRRNGAKQKNLVREITDIPYRNWLMSHTKPSTKLHTDRFFYGGNMFKVLTRDGFQCTRCTATGKQRLVVHHIDRSGRTKHPNGSMDNLITLCKRCHSIEHQGDNIIGNIKAYILKDSGFRDRIQMEIFKNGNH